VSRAARSIAASALLIAGASTAHAQSTATHGATQPATAADRMADSVRLELDRAVDANDSARLAAAVLLLDRALAAYPTDPRLLHYRGYAGYRQAIEHMKTGTIASAAGVLSRAVADLERSAEKLRWPETYALLASLTGLQIAADPSRGMELGMQIGALNARAAERGPNPRVRLLQAEATASTPPEFGGGEPARALLARALAAFADDRPAPLAPAWGHDEAKRFEKTLGK
jgi:hypothetical protein